MDHPMLPPLPLMAVMVSIAYYDEVEPHDDQMVANVNPEDYRRDTEEVRASRLVDTLKFQSFCDDMGFSEASRAEMTKAILRAAEEFAEECVMSDRVVIKSRRAPPAPSNVMTFSESDKKTDAQHNRPLYVTVVINGVEFKRGFVDDGAAVNMIPLNTLELAGFLEKRIVKRRDIK